MPKICLNMIVKNESKIITRLLTSVLPIIDYYCICDTGSTDDTVEIITKFFQTTNIVGKITYEPFKDFAHNRTFSLHQCVNIPAEYLLLLDADMILDTSNLKNIEEFKNSLTMDGYYLYQGNDKLFYKNIRIIKNNPNIIYWGVTHEYVKFPQGSQSGEILKSVLFIKDLGDGGSKIDKYERDIRLLEKGLEEIPNDARYTFYLANSYKDAGQYENAIKNYKKRIEIGGWIEEIWHSYYSIGNCYLKLNDIPNAIYYWMEGYQYFPDRVENLYEIIKYYRENSKNKLANIFYDIARYELNKKTNYDHLFLQNDVYSYKIEYEHTICGYYNSRNNIDIRIECMNVLNNEIAPKNIKDNVLSNYKYYSLPLVSRSINNENIEILNNIGYNLDIDRNIFIPSTPSICVDDNKKELLVCRRFVNYKIGEKGEYINEKNIITKNIIAVMDISNAKWNKKYEFELKYDTIYDDQYIGIEDVRLFLFDGLLYFNGNRGIKRNNICIEHGKINLFLRQTNSTIVKCENQNNIEKNWVLFENSSKLMKMIYNWYPLTIGSHGDHPTCLIDEHNKPNTFLKITDTIDTPPFFKYIRGSTNGINIGNEIWFICHIVSYEMRRFYYHVVVVIDDSTYKIKRFTKMFTFEKEKVEYTLGFAFLKENDEFMIGYSTMDKCTKYILVSKSDIEELFYQ
jgi:glycosyltransferase involved in cell wall biosynthesis